MRYVPPFDFYYQSDGDTQGELVDGGTQHVAWRIVAADFVTTDSGTGAVHQAPAFGEVDYAVLMDERNRFVAGSGPPLICAVGPDGKFTAEAPDYEGKWVKDADKEITRALRDRDLLFHQDQYLHDYPFCWRAEEDPLIQYPRKSWFIRTTEFKDRAARQQRQDQLVAGAHPRRAIWKFPRIERRLGAVARALLGHSPADLGLRRNRLSGSDRQLRRIAGQARLTGTDVWEAAKQKNPGLAGRSSGPQTVHRRGHVRFAQGCRQTHAPRHGSHRLLV